MFKKILLSAALLGFSGCFPDCSSQTEECKQNCKTYCQYDVFGQLLTVEESEQCQHECLVDNCSLKTKVNDKNDAGLSDIEDYDASELDGGYLPPEEDYDAGIDNACIRRCVEGLQYEQCNQEYNCCHRTCNM